MRFKLLTSGGFQLTERLSPFRHPLAALAGADLSAHTIKIRQIDISIRQNLPPDFGLPTKMRRGGNGLCADPLAKTRFYRLAAAAVFIFLYNKALGGFPR